PFGSNDGSQSKPQPLSFFIDYFGETAEVKAVSIQQGTSTEGTSVVTSMTVGGESLDLGIADVTPFDQADVDAAVAPLLAALDSADTAMDAAEADLAALQTEVDAANVDLEKASKEIADLKAELASAKSAAAKA